MEINSHRNYVEGKIDRFEKKIAIIKLKDGQEISWPANNLPDDVQVKGKVRLVLTTTKTEAEEHEKIAKNILNKIFK